MAQDIRDMFKNDRISDKVMPKDHQERFLKKLNEALPEAKNASVKWYNIAASVVLVLGLSYGAFTYFSTFNKVDLNTKVANASETKTLGDVSPGLKKVEDYYLASINLELSKIQYTPETKDLFEGYLKQLEELNLEYQRLSTVLTEDGPTELTVNALIDNLKFRLNLLYRLREQLKEFKTTETHAEQKSQSA